jgi:VanZ family protein
MHVQRNTLKQWLPFIIWVVLVFAVSSIPHLAVPAFGMPHWSDKIAHLTEYAVLAFLFYRGEGGGRWRMGIPAWLLVIAGGIAIAGIDEYHQRFIPGRDSDILDWTADATGIVIGTLIGLWRFGAFSRRAEKT